DGFTTRVVARRGLRHPHSWCEAVAPFSVAGDEAQTHFCFAAIAGDSQVHILASVPPKRLTNDLPPEPPVSWPLDPLRGPTILDVRGKHHGASEAILPARQDRRTRFRGKE